MDSDPGIFKKDSLPLRDGAFFHNLAYISGEIDMDFHENFITYVSMDKEVPVNFRR